MLSTITPMAAYPFNESEPRLDGQLQSRNGGRSPANLRKQSTTVSARPHMEPEFGGNNLITLQRSRRLFTHNTGKRNTRKNAPTSLPEVMTRCSFRRLKHQCRHGRADCRRSKSMLKKQPTEQHRGKAGAEVPRRGQQIPREEDKVCPRKLAGREWRVHG
jgi:hypothetical protein